MKFYLKTPFILLTTVLLLAGCSGTNKPATTTKPTEKNVIDAYVYLLGRALAVRQEQTDLSEAGVGYNVIKYNEVGKADFVNPNLDVAYMEAWLAVDENSAVILEVPKVEGRYYTVQLMDGWGEVFTNINERNYPNHPYGKYALCLENTTANIPDDALKVIVPTKKIKMLARVELQNTIDKAVELQKQFKVSVIGTPQIEPIPALPTFTNNELLDLAVFENIDELLKVTDTKLASGDSIQEISRNVSAYLKQAETNATEVKSIIKEKAIPQFMQYAISNAGKLENNWLATLYTGEYNGNYWMRTAANFVGIWANTPAEVVYLIASNDVGGQPLAGGQAYELVFDKDKLPIESVHAFWSVILVDFPNYRVVPNELNRFNFNNYTKFAYNKDGSLSIYIAPEYNKAWPKSNWLPSPKDGKFNLTIRMYVPKDNVLKGEWFPSGVAKI